MNNTTRIIIAGIFGYTAYRISKELSSAMYHENLYRKESH